MITMSDETEELELLQKLLWYSYLLCKHIDSTDWWDKWPGEIREHVAQAYDSITEFNRGLWNLKQGVDSESVRDSE